MTSINFYFNAGDRLQVACRLAGKALAQGKAHQQRHRAAG